MQLQVNGRTKCVSSLDNHRLTETLQFFAKMNLFALPLYIILAFNLQFAFLQTVTRDITFFLLQGLGFNPALNGYLISVPIANGNWAASIDWDCTGWKSMLAFFALVMATGRDNRTKMRGLLVFIPAIFAINILRIVFMFYFVSAYDLAYYGIVHQTIWSWGLIATILAFWVIWLRKAEWFNGNDGRNHKAGRKQK